MKKKWIVAGLIALVVLLHGCGDVCYRGPVEATDTTPAGYQVNIPESIYQHGLYLVDRTLTDSEEIRGKLLWFVDYRIQEWIDRHGDYDREYLEAVAAAQVYVLHDNIALPCGHCYSGVSLGFYRPGQVDTLIYALRAYEDSGPDCGYPPYLLYSGPEFAVIADNASWSIYQSVFGEASDSEIFTVGANSIPHELDHAIGINGDV